MEHTVASKRPLLFSGIFIATFLSASIHAVSFWSYVTYFSAPQLAKSNVAKHINIQIVFRKKPPAVNNVPDQVEQEQPQVIEKNNVPEPNPAPLPEKQVVKKEPVVKKKTVVSKPEITKQVIEPEAESKPVEIASNPAPPAPAILVEDTREVDLKSVYMSSILKEIEENKFYPRKARRRNIEGEVLVSLHVNPDGSIGELQTLSGHNVLKKAARKAILQAQPFQRPPAGLTSLNPVRFEMIYRFK